MVHDVCEENLQVDEVGRILRTFCDSPKTCTARRRRAGGLRALVLVAKSLRDDCSYLSYGGGPEDATYGPIGRKRPCLVGISFRLFEETRRTRGISLLDQRFLANSPIGVRCSSPCTDTDCLLG